MAEIYLRDRKDGEQQLSDDYQNKPFDLFTKTGF